MMKVLWLLVFMFSSPAFSTSGGDVGNGGDSVFCNPVAGNPYRGYYALDYLVNKINGMEFANDFEKVVGPNDRPDKNFLRIIEAAKEYPVLVQELKEFLKLSYSNKYLQRYIWKKAPFGVVEIADEQLRLQIPPNCLSPNKNVIQTIFRVSKPWEMVWLGEDRHNHTVYSRGAEFTYSNEVMSQMSSLQLSFLLFHEWLWNLTDDPEMIRDLNAIFHSTGWDNGGADKMMGMLKKFNWSNSTPPIMFKGYPSN
jgi:hypothetical protein